MGAGKRDSKGRGSDFGRTARAGRGKRDVSAEGMIWEGE